MGKEKQAILTVGSHPVKGYTKDFEAHFLSLTDIALTKSDAPKDVIQNWMRTKDTLQYLSIWESLNNPDFDSSKLDDIMRQAGSNAFTMSPKRWIELTNAIGINSKMGRHGGVFAHSEIALEFAGWISAEFKLLLNREFMKAVSGDTGLSKVWSEQRLLARVNYRVHTDAVQEFLITPDLTPAQINRTYASEADLINVALFGCTAAEWRDRNPDKTGNMRDYAKIEELLILGNLETYSASLIADKVPDAERIRRLRQMRDRILQSYRASKNALASLSSVRHALPSQTDSD